MDAQNKQNILALKSLLEQKRPILFIGAGFSKRAANYPRYGELFTQMNACVAEKLARNTEVAEQGNVALSFSNLHDVTIQAGRGEIFYDCLRESFSAQPPNFEVPNHLKLLKLGFAGVVTTNYDDSVRKTIDLIQDLPSVTEDLSTSTIATPSTCEVLNLTHPDGLVGKFHAYLNSLSRPLSDGRFPGVLHLHGHLDQSEKVILTKKDMDQHYGTDTFTRRILYAIMLMHPIVFFGFSMGDSQIQDLLARAKDDLKRGKGDRSNWFIITSRSDENRHTQLEEWGLSPIYVEDFEDDRHLADILDELASTEPEPSPLYGPAESQPATTTTTPQNLERDVESIDNFTDSMLNL